MQKTIRQLKKAGQIFLVGTSLVTLLNSCSANLGSRKFPEGMIHNFDLETLTQSAVPYKSEEIFINNEGYYIHELPEEVYQEIEAKDATATNYKKFSIQPSDKTSRTLDLDSKEVVFNSSKDYIPKKVKEKSGNFKDFVILSMYDSPITGIRGIKASITQWKDLEKRVKDFNSGTFKFTGNENDAAFGIRIIKIKDKWYFTPYVAHELMNQKGKLDYYIIPVENAQIKIDEKNGQITIINRDNIYRPELTEIPERTFSQTQPTKKQDISYEVSSAKSHYLIQNGDTLFKIAQKYNTSVTELMKLNPQIKDKDKIYTGDKIKVK